MAFEARASAAIENRLMLNFRLGYLSRLNTQLNSAIVFYINSPVIR